MKYSWLGSYAWPELFLARSISLPCLQIEEWKCQYSSQWFCYKSAWDALITQFYAWQSQQVFLRWCQQVGAQAEKFMWEGMFLQNPVRANWKSLCLRFLRKWPFLLDVACIRILGLINVVLKPALDYLWMNCVNGEPSVQRGQNIPSESRWADWKQRGILLLIFQLGKLSRWQDCWRFFPQHPIPDSFVWFLLLKVLFCQGSPIPLFSWITDVYSAPIRLLSCSTAVWSHCVLWWVWGRRYYVWWLPKPCSFTSSLLLLPFWLWESVQC